MRSRSYCPCGKFSTAPGVSQGPGDVTHNVTKATGHNPEGPILGGCSLGAGEAAGHSGTSGMWLGRKGQKGRLHSQWSEGRQRPGFLPAKACGTLGSLCLAAYPKGPSGGWAVPAFQAVGLRDACICFPGLLYKVPPTRCLQTAESYHPTVLEIRNRGVNRAVLSLKPIADKLPCLL